MVPHHHTVVILHRGGARQGKAAWQRGWAGCGGCSRSCPNVTSPHLLVLRAAH